MAVADKARVISSPTSLSTFAKEATKVAATMKGTTAINSHWTFFRKCASFPSFSRIWPNNTINTDKKNKTITSKEASNAESGKGNDGRGDFISSMSGDDLEAKDDHCSGGKAAEGVA